MKKTYGYIYKIVCKVTGKLYIGQTIGKLSNRLNGHFYDSQKGGCTTKIGRAFRKHGRDSFVIFPVCKADSRQELNNREIACIRLFNSVKKGYNISDGGYHSTPSEETRKKMSLAGKGKPKPQGHGEKVSRALKGKKHSESHRRNNVRAQIACQAHHEYRHNEETLKKMSLAGKGKPKPEGFGEGVAQRNRDRGPASDDTKKKMSEKRQGRKPNQRPVVCLNTGIQYPSVKSAAETLKISVDSLGKHLKGKLKTATAGRIFKYVK